MKLFRSVTISAVVALLATALTYAPASAKPTANVAKELGRWSEPFWEGGNEPYDPPTRKTSRKYPVAAA
ncbi:MAG TPA: hypothetical protein VG408_10825, partial [Actinomycetota bacterium]|nr:hypothetical protein [Actinomycetota bacterium]